MTEYTVSIEGEILNELAESFRLGKIVEHEGQEIHFLVEHVVSRVNGVKVEIFSNEHPPPHFRVIYQGSTANFQISDCKLINGSGEVIKYRKNIEKWWSTNKKTLIDTWNSRRPSDCTVGEYRE